MDGHTMNREKIRYLLGVLEDSTGKTLRKHSEELYLMLTKYNSLELPASVLIESLTKEIKNILNIQEL